LLYYAYAYTQKHTKEARQATAQQI